MKRSWWWIGAVGALAIMLIVVIIVPRVAEHRTHLALTVYCEGQLFFPAAAVSTVGSSQPCLLENLDAPGQPVIVTVYQQSCALPSSPISIPTMQPTTFVCVLPGSSRFTATDDGALQSEMVGQCLGDLSGVTANSPCRLFITALAWR